MTEKEAKQLEKIARQVQTAEAWRTAAAAWWELKNAQRAEECEACADMLE